MKYLSTIPRAKNLATLCLLLTLCGAVVVAAEKFVDESSPEWKEIYDPPVKSPTEVKKGSKLRKELFGLLRPKISAKVDGKKVLFEGSLKVYRNWAFFSGRTVDAVGKAVAIGELGNSDTVALWLRTVDGWRVVDFSGGHSDVFYIVWPEQYGVSRTLMGFK